MLLIVALKVDANTRSVHNETAFSRAVGTGETTPTTVAAPPRQTHAEPPVPRMDPCDIHARGRRCASTCRKARRTEKRPARAPPRRVAAAVRAPRTRVRAAATLSGSDVASGRPAPRRSRSTPAARGRRDARQGDHSALVCGPPSAEAAGPHALGPACRALSGSSALPWHGRCLGARTPARTARPTCAARHPSPKELT